MFPVAFSSSAAPRRWPVTVAKCRPTAAIPLLIFASLTLGGCAIKMPSLGGFATGSNAARPSPPPDQERYAMGVPPAAYGTPGTSHRRNAMRSYSSNRYGGEAGTTADTRATAPNSWNTDRHYLAPRSPMPARTLPRDRSRQWGEPRLFERSRDDLAPGGPFAQPLSRYRRPMAPARRQGERGDRYEVQLGDTIYGIARNAGISAQALINANQLADPSQLQIGMILTLPR